MAERHGHLRRYDIAAPRLRRARRTAKAVPSLAQSLALLRSAARLRRGIITDVRRCLSLHVNIFYCPLVALL